MTSDAHRRIAQIPGGLSRRTFINSSLSYYTALLGLPIVSACTANNMKKVASNLSHLGELQAADQNGCRLPPGFSSKVIANSSQTVVAGNEFKWHTAPDGGECFADTQSGGWYYVSNSEASSGAGGASAIKFDRTGAIVDAYSILSNTSRNCAGGATPYSTWLSCEELNNIGRVFECDPTGLSTAIERPALGYFAHEAVAYDTREHKLYLTEDRPDGGLYRFTPAALRDDGYADLSAGLLEIAQMVLIEGVQTLRWHIVGDPLGQNTPTRYQVSESMAFDGGEGIAYINGLVSFTTKGDNRVWLYNVADSSIKILYDDNTSETPILTGVDNITVNFSGEYLVAEDGGDMQIIVLKPDGAVRPLLALEGQNRSEITGPAFSPDGSRLYFSSQRGISGRSAEGITYEISGPFFSEV